MSPSAFRIVPCGDDALRIACGAGHIRYQLAQLLKSEGSWREIVPGKVDVTVAFDPHAESMMVAMGRLHAALEADLSLVSTGSRRIELCAHFGGPDGPDLERIAQDCGQAPGDIIAAVEGSRLSVDMLGFTPGFAYITGLDPSLVSARLANPRARVAAGSIGLITGQIGLYALDGPGGWPIIGRVHTQLFDRTAPDPFRLMPGDEIVFRRSTDE